MLIFILSVCFASVLSSPQTPNEPEIITSYSTVIKEFPNDPYTDQSRVQTNFVPKIIPNDPLNDDNFLEIPTESSPDIITNFNGVRKTVDQSWLDLTNVSKRSDHVNSTLKAIQYLKELNASANQRTKNISTESAYLCSETFGDEEFFIRSPNYPFNYPAYTNCKFTVKRLGKSICGIIFTILRFDVGPTGSSDTNAAGTCPGDKVLIGNQVICGRMRRGTESFSRFTSSTFNLTFTSGNGFGASGFLIKGKQSHFCLPDKPLSPPLRSSVPCDSIITEEEFSIASPSFPNLYPDDVECHYEVHQSNWNICGLMLTPSFFDVEGAAYCMFDYMEIQGKRLCGNLTSKEQYYYMFETDKIDIRFRSDESVSKAGFNFRGKQILCSDLEFFQPIHSPLVATDTLRESKAEEDLHNYQDIRYILSLLVKTGLPTDLIEDSFDRDAKSISVDENNKTDFDFLSLGPNENESEVLEASQTRDQNYIQNVIQLEPETDFNDDDSDDNNELYSPQVYFPIPNKYPRDSLSSSSQKDLLSSSTCDERHSEQVFFIQSVNYPDNYSDNLDCAYYIYRSSPDVCQLRLTLEDINIEKSSSVPEDCGDDYLDIAGYKICGSFKKTILNIAFTGETVIIRFKSNSEVTDKGYLITVEQIDKECASRGRKTEDLACDSVIRYDNFTIYSPGYPHWYPLNMWCTTTIIKTNPNIRSLEVFFQEFDLELSPQCEKDFLSIGTRRFCGQKSGNSYVFPFEDDSIQLTFATNEDISSNGFRIYMKQVSDSSSREPEGVPRCGGEYYSAVNILTSPEFPADYEGDLHCVYSILKNSEDICQLQIKIIDFDIEPSPGCRRDYLQLGLRRLCGPNYVNELHNYHFSSDKFNVIFHSDLQNSGKGFRIEVTQRSCLNTIDTNLQTPPPIITAPPPFTRPDPNREIEFPTIVPPSRPSFPTYPKPYPKPYPNAGGNFPIKYDPNCMKNFRVIKYKPATRPRPPSKVAWPTPCPLCNKLYPYNYNHGHNYYNTYKTVPTSSVYVKPNQIYSQSSSQIYNGRIPNIAGTYYYNNWQPQPQVYRVSYGRSISERNKTFDNIPRDLTFSTDTTLQGSPPRDLTFSRDTALQGSPSQFSGNKILDFLNRNNSTIETGSHTIGNSFKLPVNPFQPQISSHTPRPQVYFPANEKPSDLFASGSAFLNGRFNPPSPAGPVMIVKEFPPITKGNSAENFLLKLQNETPDFSQSVNLCNKSISLETFEMKSPGYPGPYYTNMNCYYLIYRKDESRCGLLLNIDMLDLPGSPSCAESYLSISGRKFCGSKENGITIVVPFSASSPIVIEFRSNTFYTGGGFSLKARQIPCNFTMSSGRNVFHSKNFENFVDAVPSQSGRFETVLRPPTGRFVSDDEIISQNYLHDLNEDEKFLNADFKPLHSPPVTKGHLTVPWVGRRATKHPPYKTGLDLLGRVKG